MVRVYLGILGAAGVLAVKFWKVVAGARIHPPGMIPGASA
jgi:hypothetical protein